MIQENHEVGTEQTSLRERIERYGLHTSIPLANR